MKQRILTAIVLAPIVFGALLVTNWWPLVILAVIIALVSGHEISTLLGKPSLLAAGAAAVISVALVIADVPPSILLFLFAVGVGAAGISAHSRSPVWIPFALLWVAAPLASLVTLHGSSSTSLSFAPNATLLAIVPLWGGDTAAIFAGKAFGKHPLAPAISPKKTWEGAIANLLACVGVAWLLGVWIGTPLAVSLGAGVIAGVLGQAGDLFESYVKRRADLKDSGSILPGHGGLMDRIDSTLFTASAVALLVTLGSPQ